MHSGNLEGGHFTSINKLDTGKQEKEWIYCDDNNVARLLNCESEEILNNLPDSHILLYNSL